MRRRYVTLDVFTDRRYTGNPLAVVLDAEGLETAEMQLIAAEFNYSETTFVLPARDTANTAHIRIFTPRFELPFAGHPNVGTAFALASHLNGASSATHMRFEQASGIVSMELLREDGRIIGSELTAPQALARRSAVPADMIADCAGVPARHILTGTHPPIVASVGLPFILAEVDSREVLREALPDTAAFEASFPVDGAGGIYLYTREVEDDRRDLCDIEARMFSTLDGIWEDPATGSAAGALTALLAKADPRSDAEFRLRVSQGVDLGRPSLIRGTATKEAGTLRSVRIGGECVPVMEGTF